jgi:hypothetical protein
MISLLWAAPLLAGDSAITGTVSGPDEFSPVGVNVVVIPCPSFLTCNGGDPLPVVASDTNGSFLISDLPSGFYSVVAFHPGSLGWTTHPFFLPEGQTATVSPSLPSRDGGSVVQFLNPTASQLSQYTRVLESLDEPPLCSEEGTAEEVEHYRFLWRRGYKPTVVARLTVYKTGEIIARFKQASEAQSVEVTVAEDLSADLIKNLTDKGLNSKMAASIPRVIQRNADDQFWGLPYEINDGTRGVNGATWVVEGVRGEKCHVVKRLSPGREDPLREFALRIVAHAGKRLYFDEVY